jgi:hypothetical protein
VYVPIGIVNDDDLMAELSRLNPSLKKPEVRVPEVIIQEQPTRGRAEGDNNVPDSLRQIIGEEAVINGRSAAVGLAGMFGISPSSASAYAKGATSTDSYNTPSKSIIGHINKSRARAINRAGKTLNAALGSITQEKLDYADARDLSTIAKDMSVIIKNLEPEAPPPVDPNAPQTPQYVIYAPTFRDERSYDSITVQE